MAGGPVQAGGHGAVVDVFRAVGSRPAVDADARVATHRVGTGGTVLADAGTQSALVHVAATVRSRVGRRTVARVRIDAVQTGGAVLAQVARTVIHVHLAVGAREPWWTGALVH